MDKIQKTLLTISYALKASLIIAVIGAIITKHYETLIFALLTLFLTFVPAMFEKNYKIILPIEFDLLITIFIYASLFLGEVHSYYTLFWWWDIILHISSGIIFGIIGFMLVYILNQEQKVKIQLSAGFIALFSFTFALSIGAIWEIFEFGVDQIFGANMQKSGLIDTMWDLIVDSLGAILISTLGYFYLKKVKIPLFNYLITKFTQKNLRKNKHKTISN